MVDESGRLLVGKIRRQRLLEREPEYVARMLSLRMGECTRCGVCCSMVFTCSHYVDVLGCSIHADRPEVCRAFPIDQDDLDDVRAAGGSCSYWFQPGATASVGLGGVRPQVGHAAFTPGMLSYAAAGLLAGVTGVPWPVVLCGGLWWEIVEQPIKQACPGCFMSPVLDSPFNSMSEIGLTLAGWMIGDKFRRMR